MSNVLPIICTYLIFITWCRLKADSSNARDLMSKQQSFRYILYLNPISVFFFSFLLHCLSKNLIICKTVSFKLMTFYISVFR